jgi:hypothetical protein
MAVFVLTLQLHDASPSASMSPSLLAAGTRTTIAALQAIKAAFLLVSGMNKDHHLDFLLPWQLALIADCSCYQALDPGHIKASRGASGREEQ